MNTDKVHGKIFEILDYNINESNEVTMINVASMNIKMNDYPPHILKYCLQNILLKSYIQLKVT